MTPSPRTFRLMTWNVHRCVGLDRKHSPERIAQVIRDHDPDVVALQELEVNHKRTGKIHQPRHLADLLKMDYHYHPPRTQGDIGFGNAILTRHNIRSVRTGILPSHRFVKTQKRGALWATLEMDGQEVQVINTHLGLVGSERILQASALCGENWLDHPDCRMAPRIICGDFNATPKSRVYRIFKDTLHDAQDLAGEPKARTWPSFMPIVRYDHVFVCPSVKARRVEIPRNRATFVASDHLPVVMEFHLSNGTVAI